jgi:hypothetical protein
LGATPAQHRIWTTALDNPGDWPEYAFKAKITKGDKKINKLQAYSHNALPTGARPVPKNEEGVREHSGWRIEYKGWDPKDSADLAWEEVRSGATRKKLFPEERKGRLDYELLCKLGVNNAIINCDPLLFYQLVLPLGDPSKNKLEGDLEDPRMPFY